MDDAEHTRRVLHDLKDLGIRVSIDDFGTGYSSLSYLRRFPIDTLKIDRSFVSHIDGDEENRQIVKTIMLLASNLGMDVIAEGAETRHSTNPWMEMRLGRCFPARHTESPLPLLSAGPPFANDR
jgi:EAL domain-containing protein (putative c-di-GMP-specific phosphodiesterase class I)